MGRAQAGARDDAEHRLEPVAANEADVNLWAVPDDAWLLQERRIPLRAAVGLDLASHPDSRSARVGAEVLAELDAARAGTVERIAELDALDRAAACLVLPVSRRL